jgi:hypothetical protein
MVPRSGRWRTTFKHKSHRYCLGTFSTAEEAARVWDLAAIKSRAPNFTGLNFPRESYVFEMDLLDKHTLEETLDMLKVKLIDAKRSGRAVKRKLDNALAEEKMGLTTKAPTSPAAHRGEPLPLSPVRKGSILPPPPLQRPDVTNPFSRPALIGTRSLRATDAIQIANSAPMPSSRHELTFGSAPSKLTLPEAMSRHTRLPPGSTSGLTSPQHHSHSQCVSPGAEPTRGPAFRTHLSAALDGCFASEADSYHSPARSLDLPAHHGVHPSHATDSLSRDNTGPSSPACRSAPGARLLSVDGSFTLDDPTSAFCGSPHSGPLPSVPALVSACAATSWNNNEAEMSREGVLSSLRRSWSEHAALPVGTGAPAKEADAGTQSDEESSGLLIDGAHGPWGGLEWTQEALVDTATDTGHQGLSAEGRPRSLAGLWGPDHTAEEPGSLSAAAGSSAAADRMPSAEPVRVFCCSARAGLHACDASGSQFTLLQLLSVW